MTIFHKSIFDFFKKILAAVRIKDWWEFILPPIVGFYFIGILINPVDINGTIILKGLFLLVGISIPTAAFGFFLNEWTDIDDDLSAGKVNNAVSVPYVFRLPLLFFLILLLLFPVWCFGANSLVKGLLSLQVILLVLYSCKPFRLKRIPFVAIILDALYSGTLFYLLAAYMLNPVIDAKNAGFVIFIGLFKGVRSIIHHLLADKNYDKTSGQITAAHLIANNKLLKLQELLWYLEALLLLVLFYFTGPVSFWIMIFAVIMSFVKLNYYTRFGYKHGHSKNNWLEEINTVYEVWLPVAAIIGVTIHWSWWMPLIGVAVFAFFFRGTWKIFSDIYLAILNFYYLIVYIGYKVYYLFYNIYYWISDLYFIHTKPHFDIGKIFRKIIGK